MARKKKTHEPGKHEAAKEAREESPGSAEPQQAAIAGASEPLGSCRWTDFSGQIQCESPVSKGYCDAKSGFWVENGRC
jgi:hypothetical protein